MKVVNDEQYATLLKTENKKLGDLVRLRDKQLADAQAQIKVLRDALNAAKYATKPSITLEMIEAALATPTDDSALREMLKQERERCAKVCDRLGDEYADANAADCADKIRAMEKSK